jgi:hypothetical protein
MVPVRLFRQAVQVLGDRISYPWIDDAPKAWLASHLGIGQLNKLSLCKPEQPDSIIAHVQFRTLWVLQLHCSFVTLLSNFALYGREVGPTSFSWF